MPARAAAEAVRALPQLFCFGFDGLVPTPFVRRFLGDRDGGGTILFRRNFESAEQLRSLNEELRSLPRTPPFAMVDQEGGPVRRLGDLGSPVPAMADVGKTGDPRLARRVGTLLAREVRAVGFNVDCAPVLDVHTNPDNPIIAARAIGSDPQQVGLMGAALVGGLHAGGVIACGKHFPGHGDTAADSHLELPRLPHDRARLDAVELAPFRIVLERQTLGLIMTAHVVYEGVDATLPASLSPAVLSILRRDLRYDGVVITDDLEMRAILDGYGMAEVVRLGLVADADVFLICQTESLQEEALAAAERLVTDGVVKPDRIARSIRRIARTKSFLRAQPVAPAEELHEVLRCDEHLALCERIPHGR